jgi:hypothetical protein
MCSPETWVIQLLYNDPSTFDVADNTVGTHQNPDYVTGLMLCFRNLTSPAKQTKESCQQPLSLRQQSAQRRRHTAWRNFEPKAITIAVRTIVVQTNDKFNSTSRFTELVRSGWASDLNSHSRYYTMPEDVPDLTRKGRRDARKG